MKRVLLVILVIVTVVACEKEDRLSSIGVIPTVDAYVGNSISLEVSHTPADVLIPAYHFRTSDQFVASVNEQGRIICKHVGSCTIFVATADARFSTTCIIHVKPNHELFDVPVLDFKTTKTIVKLKETDKTLVYETPTMLVYQGNENPIQQLVYLFDETQKLESSVVKLASSVSSELAAFMDEYFEQYQSAEGDNLQAWSGNGTEAVVKVTNDACFVVYSPFSGNTTHTMATKIIERSIYSDGK